MHASESAFSTTCNALNGIEHGEKHFAATQQSATDGNCEREYSQQEDRVR